MVREQRTGAKETKTQTKPSSKRRSSCWETTKANRDERQTDKGDIHKGPECSGQSKTSVWFDDMDEIGVVFETVSKGESDGQQAVLGGQAGSTRSLLNNVRRNGKQLFTHKPPFRAVLQIIHNWLVGLHNMIAFKDQMGSVARCCPPSSSPGGYR